MKAWNLCHVSWLTKAAYSPWAHLLMLRCYIITDNQRNNQKKCLTLMQKISLVISRSMLYRLWIHFWSAAENLQPSSEEWLTAALSSKIRSTPRLTTQSALLTWSQWWHRDVKLLMHPKASVMACANIIAVWSSWREMGSGQRSFTSCLTYVSIGATWCRSRGKEVNNTIRLFLI